MNVENQWPMPKWLGEIPDVERQPATTRFLLCLAAIYIKDRGSTADLARELGLNANQINVMKARGQVSGEIAVKIETLLGRETFPRELFRPDLFLISAE